MLTLFILEFWLHFAGNSKKEIIENLI